MAKTHLHINSFSQKFNYYWHPRGLGGHENAKNIVHIVMHASLADVRTKSPVPVCVIKGPQLRFSETHLKSHLKGLILTQINSAFMVRCIYQINHHEVKH